MADIQPPDLETRMAIARNKAASIDLKLADEQISYIATRIKSNVRQLEGVINKLAAYNEILHVPISREMIDRVIEEVIRTADGAPSPEIIIRETSKYFSLTAEQLKGNNRSKSFTMPRQIAMYMMRKLTALSLNDIGQALNRNQTTAMSSISKVESLLKTNPEIAGVLRDIESNIANTAELKR